jgi:hypothetical protein
MLIAASILAGIIVLFSLLSAFGGAVVTIVPKQESADISEQLRATNMDAPTGASLTYKLTSISETVSTDVKATGEETVETKASGIITIYNTYTDKSQPLVKNTRFETEDGRIYRIGQSITVPGMKGTQPGTIDAEVFADAAGESYNVESAKFTIPGFEGQPQFDKFYAQTKTAISGGFNGVRKVVSEADQDSAEANLKTQLITKLQEKVLAEITPETTVVFDDRLISMGELKQTEGSRDMVSLSLTGTLQALIFSKDNFYRALAGESLTVFNPEDTVYVLDESKLQIALAPEFDPATGLDEATVSVSGSAQFVWKTDHELLKKQLSGKQKKELKSILQEFSSIAKAEAVIKPFWKSAFPEIVEKIRIEEVLESPAQ